jgi:hypothetical protein
MAMQNPGSGSLKYCLVFLVCNEWQLPEVPNVLKEGKISQNNVNNSFKIITRFTG